MVAHQTPQDLPPTREDKPYVPHDTLNETTKTGIAGLLAGVFAVSIKNSLAQKNIGPLSMFSRGAPMIGICAAAPATYAFTSRTMMNLREKEDALAAGVGGFMMGGVLGLPSRRMPIVMGLGAAVGLFQGFFYYLGNRYDSFKVEDDEFKRKEVLRRTTRVPIEQTIANIGEGRGIRPPGYEERRRERLKENYGYEVDPVKATVDGSQ